MTSMSGEPSTAAASRPPQPSRRVRRFRPGRRTILIVAALLVLLAVDSTRRVVQIRGDLLQANAAINRSRSTLRPLLQFRAEAWPNRAGYAALVADMASADEHLAAARGRLGYLRWFAVAFGVVPVVGEQVAAAPRVLDLGADVSHHGTALLREGEPLFAGSGRIAERAREVLVTRAAPLDVALAALEASAADARALQSVQWYGPAARADRLIDELAADLSRVSEVRALTAVSSKGLDTLLGFDAPRKYVVIGQNEQEIRPTGGYVGTMGVITVADGRLVDSDYRSSYEFDPVGRNRRPPARSLQQYMGAGAWYVRDANWDPDFPTSAKRTLDFLEQDQGIRADGVVAVNTPMIQRLLRVTGPLTIEGFAEPLTADNFLTQLEEEIFEPGLDSTQRKRQLLQPVLRDLIARVQDADAEKVPALIAAMTAGVRARDLQVYTRSDPAFALVAGVGASGTLDPTPGNDFVAIVDSNISYNKIQIAIRRDITYLARGDGRVDLLVQWTNERSSFSGTRYVRLGKGGEIWDPLRRRMDPAEGTFGNFVRIYFPPGTTFELMEGFSRPPGLEDIDGLRVLSGLVKVPDGARVALRLTYLPGGASATPVKAVDFWKQGGQTRDTLRVAIAQGEQQSTAFDGAFTKDMTFPYLRPVGRR